MTYTPTVWVNAAPPNVNATNLNKIEAGISAAHSNIATSGVIGIDVSNSSGDVAAIVAAISSGTTGGKVNGKWQTKSGGIARITTPTTISLGYSSTWNANWATDTTIEKVKLSLDILPDAGLGAALTIKGGYGTELDINVLGGGATGTVTDAAMTGRTTSSDGTMTLNSSTLTSASASFTSADVGAPISVPGADAAGATLYGNISSVTNGTTVVLNVAAQTAVTTAAVYIGSFTVSSATAIAAGVAVGGIVQITGAGPAPEGIRQPLWASVRSVNSGAGTFTISEGCWANVSSAAMRWLDVAIRIEDLMGAKINITAKGYKGYVLAADATNDVNRKIRSVTFDKINCNGVGGALFFKSVEAFGSLGQIMSSNQYGDYFGMCADMHWIHWEGGITQPTTRLALAYLWFDRSTAYNNVGVSVGDRALEACVKITGPSGAGSLNMGRLSQIRLTNYYALATGNVTSGSNLVTGVITNSLTMQVGQTFVGNGVPDGTTITAVSGSGNSYTAGSPGTITLSQNATGSSTGQNIYGMMCDGVRMIGVGGITIGMLDTAKCIAGLRVTGGGSVGITILHHKSLSTDISALVIEPGATGLTPRVRVVTADYRYTLGYPIDIASGLGAAEIAVGGNMDLMHINGGATGKYAIRSGSSSAILDIAGLHQVNRAGLLGVVNESNISLRGKPFARLDNQIPAANTVYLNDGSGSHTLAAYTAGGALAVGSGQIVVSNTVSATLVTGVYTIPANTVVAGTTYRICAWGTVDNDAGATVTLRFRVGGVGGTSVATPIAITNASAKTGQAWNLNYLLSWQGNASSSTPTVVGGQCYSATSGFTGAQGAAATSVNMTTNRDIGIDATWSAATSTNVIRCEGYTIEQVHA